MIKHLALNLTLERDHPISGRHEWARFLQQDRLDAISIHNRAEFPMLEHLALDLTDWNLKANEGLVVSAPF